MTNQRFLAIALSLLATACGSNAATAPSTTTTTTPTVAGASIEETWEGSVPVGGSKFYSFTINENGTLNVSLTVVGGQFVPSTVTLGLGVGQPAGMECTTTTTVNASTQLGMPHITGTYAPGVYCVKVYDVGNLFSDASFTVSIAHS
ncbi:MAG TPA: hypothetical protein VL173_05385 [Vicinamibacterales bacterium]|jgi:hypothetical protein|nr:hypothetical protein [Vicinamibacterales bacterium]